MFFKWILKWKTELLHKHDILLVIRLLWQRNPFACGIFYLQSFQWFFFISTTNLGFIIFNINKRSVLIISLYLQVYRESRSHSKKTSAKYPCQELPAPWISDSLIGALNLSRSHYIQ